MCNGCFYGLLDFEISIVIISVIEVIIPDDGYHGLFTDLKANDALRAELEDRFETKPIGVSDSVLMGQHASRPRHAM
jgi:hypothetical protein